MLQIFSLWLFSKRAYKLSFTIGYDVLNFSYVTIQVFKQPPLPISFTRKPTPPPTHEILQKRVTSSPFFRGVSASTEKKIARRQTGPKNMIIGSLSDTANSSYRSRKQRTIYTLLWAYQALLRLLHSSDKNVATNLKNKINKRDTVHVACTFRICCKVTGEISWRDMNYAVPFSC